EPDDTRVLPSELNTTQLKSPCSPLKVAVLSPVFGSHSLIVLSELPEARIFPSGLKASAHTWPLSLPPFNVRRFLPPATCQSVTSLSWLPTAKIFPSRLKARDTIESVCGVLKVAVFLPLSTSHRLMVLSLLTDANVLPSLLSFTFPTWSVCPSRVALS